MQDFKVSLFELLTHFDTLWSLNRQADRQTGKQTDEQADKWMKRPIHEQSDGWIDHGQTDK